MPTDQDETLLIFRIDRIPCAVAAASVQSIVMPPPQLTQPPGSDRGRPGIFRHADQVYAVVDLHQRFGIDAPRQGLGRLLLHQNGLRRHALWVDEIVGLVHSAQGQWAPLPPYLQQTLFQRGLLHQREIVLCTTLQALLAMHDAGPIRHHLESLHRTQAAASSIRTEVVASTERASPASVAAIAETTPLTAGLTAGKDATPRTTPPAKGKGPLRTARSGGGGRPSSPARKPLCPPTPAAPRHSPTNPQQRASAPPRRVAAATTRAAPLPQAAQASPHPTAPAPVTTHQGEGRWLPWALLALLLLATAGAALYLLAATPLPDTTRPSPLPVAPPSPSPQQVSPRELPPPVTASAPQEPPHHGKAALQIERDEEGTINLIIEREQIRPRRATAAAPLAAAETPARTGAWDGDGMEGPLLADADWPEPAALPAPCDCTHIVVKGDTLWDIAEHYTHSAFNYPELARQSGIRNPHRIYPGNKVRIIVR